MTRTDPWETRRTHLIQTLRRNGITNEAVLAAMAGVPREIFLDTSLRPLAYHDIPLPIGLDQTISQPLVVAYMTQLLDLRPQNRVLEVETGCGYQTAVLARLVQRVYTVERLQALLVEAESRFSALDIANIVTRFGDGRTGWAEQAPFDRILVTAGALGSQPPPALAEQLGPNGVLVLPLGEDPLEQRIVRLRRVGAGLQREELWPVRFVPLLPGTSAASAEPAGPS